MLVGAWRVFLLCLNYECDSSLEAKLRTNKADVTVKNKNLFVALSKVGLEGLLSCSEAGEGVTKFLLLVLGGVVVFFRL